MNIYLINVIFTMIWAAMLLIVGKTDNGKKAFCIITSIQWILISGLRGMSVSRDMYSYQFKFNQVKNLAWKDVFNKFYFVYVEEEGKDPGYDIFQKFVHFFTDDYQTYLFIVAIIFFTAMGIWVYKHSDYKLLSMIIFDSFLYSFFALTGTRQTLATVLIVFIGGKYIRERDFKKFLIIAIIAFTVHKSSICFVPFYFISQIPISRKYIISVLCAFPLLYIFRYRFFYLVGALVGYEYYELENSGAYTFTFLYLALVIASLFLLNYIKKNCEDYTMYFNAMFMGLLLIPLVFVNPAAMRTVQYYSLYFMLFVPKLVKSFEYRTRVPVYAAVVSLLLVVTNAFTRTDYTFFWQN